MPARAATWRKRAAITGALSLYLNFINLFHAVAAIARPARLIAWRLNAGNKSPGPCGRGFSFAAGKNNLSAMSSLEIRPATAADLPSITEIYEHAGAFRHRDVRTHPAGSRRG